MIFLWILAAFSLKELNPQFEAHSQARWIQIQERFKDGPPKWDHLEGFAKTVALMAYSQAATGLLNSYFDSNQKISQGDLKKYSTALADGVMQTGLQLQPDVSVSQFPKEGFGVYYGHLEIVLLVHRILTHDPSHDSVITAVAQYLAAQFFIEANLFASLTQTSWGEL